MKPSTLRLTTMNLFKLVTSKQLGQNWLDRSPRGRGNRAARRAIATSRGADHLRDACEDIYTDRPRILQRGAALLVIDDPRSVLPRAELIALVNRTP